MELRKCFGFLFVETTAGFEMILIKNALMPLAELVPAPFHL